VTRPAMIRIYGHTGVVGAQVYRRLAGTPGLSGVSLDRVDGDSSGVPDWAFVCVPTPTTDEGQDLSAVESVLAQLAGHESAVVIRSTVLPGTCDRIQADHPEWDVYHWPEFLSARHAAYDFTYPDTQVIGHNDRAVDWEEIWEPILPQPDGSLWTHVSLAEAECIKYAHNAHGAMQVTFANLVHDICTQSGADYGRIYHWALAMDRVGYGTVTSYWNVGKDGYRGYGGACFPKDVKALRQWLGDKCELLDGMEAANARLRRIRD
jgi:UDPglucose 6-dehydrogenase